MVESGQSSGLSTMKAQVRRKDDANSPKRLTFRLSRKDNVSSGPDVGMGAETDSNCGCNRWQSLLPSRWRHRKHRMSFNLQPLLPDEAMGG